MSVASQDTAVNSGRFARAFIYVVLLVFALFYLLPLFVMLTNSFKPLDEITGGETGAIRGAKGQARCGQSPSAGLC